MAWRGSAAWLSATALGLLVATGPAAAEPRRYVIDPEHFSVAFMGHHLGYAKAIGLFREAGGHFVYDDAVPSVSDIEVTIKAASVFTNHEARDGHLRSADFLDADAHPLIVFRGTRAEPTGPNTGRVTGDLSFRGVTLPVTVAVTLVKAAPYPMGEPRPTVGISARATVKRSLFGSTYAVANDWVADEIELMFEFEASAK